MPVSVSAGSFDSSGVVSQLVAIAQAPVDAISTKKALYDSAVSTMNTFTSRLASLKATTNTLVDAASYSSYTAASSDATVVASATGTAQPGSYNVSVTSLASIQKLRGTPQDSSSTALNMTGSLSLSVAGGAAVNIDVLPTDTLGDIATKLATSGQRVSASVLYDGSKYRLSVQGLDTGAANAFTITQNGVDLGLDDPANVFQPASDAKLVVDGLSITRPTNQITGVIPGVTLALTKPGVTSTVSVNTDTSTLKSKLTGFVAAYNDIINASHSATGYGSTKASNAVLAGDSSIRRAADNFGRIVGSAIPGTTGAYTTLASVGIKLGTDGTLSFDSSMLDAAITKDPNGVRRLFITDSSLGATGVMKTLATTIDGLVSTTNSPIKARIAALTATSTRLSDSIPDKQKHVDDYQAQLKKQFSNLDIEMSKYSSMSSAISGIGT